MHPIAVKSRRHFRSYKSKISRTKMKNIYLEFFIVAYIGLFVKQ